MPTTTTTFRSRLLALLALAAAIPAQQQPAVPAPAATATEKPSFEQAAAAVQQQLRDSVAELGKLREKIAGERIPMAQDLRELEEARLAVRSDLQRATRTKDARNLDLTNLTAEIDKRKEQAGYLANLLADHARNFESRLHIGELQRHRAALDAARLARDNASLPQADLFAAELALVEASFDRVADVLGGSRFDGKAVDAGGVVRTGTFVLIGPSAVFRSADGQQVGTVEQRLGSLEPTVVPFERPGDGEAAATLVLGTGAALPFDPTLGNAHKLAAVEETWAQHVLKGGPLMYPIFVVAIAALAVALCKWLSMAFVRRPSPKLLAQLQEAVRGGDAEAAVGHAEAIGGPTGEMLAAGAAHLGEPRELVEEVMYEKVLATKLRLDSWLPFVAICATSAPLLGLLGTVTGIMNTFTLMTVFGTGDPKTLSSGISEALITTEYGLYVAIPSLMLHAFLSRRARSIVDDMEKSAVSFLNGMRKAETSSAA
jgi:biopolymer transport protein ExbB